MNKHLKYGAPFLILMIGGPYLLRIYTQTRYDVYNERHIFSKIPPNKLEEDYEEYTKSVDIDNWKNIRGPRPWEGDNTDYKDVIEKRARESKDKWVFK